MGPSSIATITDAVGPEIAASLLRACGGWRLYVPERPPEDPMHPINRAIGAEAVRRLSAAFAGAVIEVPLLDHQTRLYLRQRQVVDMAAAGMTRNQIASHTGITHRHIRRVLKQLKGARAPMQAAESFA